MSGLLPEVLGACLGLAAVCASAPPSAQGDPFAETAAQARELVELGDLEDALELLRALDNERERPARRAFARIRIGDLALGTLPEGRFRPMLPREIEMLFKSARVGTAPPKNKLGRIRKPEARTRDGERPRDAESPREVESNREEE